MSPSKETKKKIKSRAKAKAKSKKSQEPKEPIEGSGVEASGEDMLPKVNEAESLKVQEDSALVGSVQEGNESQNEGEEVIDDTPALEKAELRLVVESLLFAANKSLTLTEMAKLIGSKVEPIEIKAVVDELIEFYQDRGMVITRVSGGFQFRTHEKSSFWVQKLIAGKPVKLSRAQVETLAIVAYRQPVTRPDIDEIRGVDSGGTLRVLLERNLVRILGKKEEPGRPLLYGTSNQFLEFFNLSELNDLPTLREFHELTDESVTEAKRRGVDLKGAKSIDEVPSPEVPSLSDEFVESEEGLGLDMSPESVSDNSEDTELDALEPLNASDAPQEESLSVEAAGKDSEKTSEEQTDSVVLEDESSDEIEVQPQLS